MTRDAPPPQRRVGRRTCVSRRAAAVTRRGTFMPGPAIACRRSVFPGLGRSFTLITIVAPRGGGDTALLQLREGRLERLVTMRDFGARPRASMMSLLRAWTGRTTVTRRIPKPALAAVAGVRPRYPNPSISRRLPEDLTTTRRSPDPGHKGHFHQRRSHHDRSQADGPPRGTTAHAHRAGPCRDAGHRRGPDRRARRYLRALPEDQEFPLAHVRPAFPRLPPDARRAGRPDLGRRPTRWPSGSARSAARHCVRSATSPGSSASPTTTPTTSRRRTCWPNSPRITDG